MIDFLSQLDLFSRRTYRKIFNPYYAHKPHGTLLIDKRGIPIQFVLDCGFQRNPALIAQFAMKYYESVNMKDNRELFMNCVNWLLNNLSDKGTYSVWEYRFGRPPWVSSLSQGQGVKVFAFADKLTKLRIFVEAASKALNTFTIPVESGGVLSIDKNDDGWWYEEFPWERSRVLNGHVEALIGVYDFYKHTNDSTALEIFQRGVKELKNHLHEYDTSLWTYYDRKGTIASLEYHKLHVEEMFWLWKTTGERIFLRYYNKWKAYLKKPSSIIYRYDLLQKILHALRMDFVFRNPLNRE